MFIRRYIYLIPVILAFSQSHSLANPDFSITGSDDSGLDFSAPSETTTTGFGASDEETASGKFFANLTREQEQDIINRAYPSLAAKWDQTSLFVCWEDFSDEHAELRQLVQQAIADTWQASSALEFLGWRACLAGSRGIRIAIKDTGPHTLGLGKFLDGVPCGSNDEGGRRPGRGRRQGLVNASPEVHS